MIYFIWKTTNSVKSLSCQNTFFNLSNSINYCVSAVRSRAIELVALRRNGRCRNGNKSEMALLLAPAGFRQCEARDIEQPKAAKMALVQAGRDGYGCDSVMVSIEACGKPFSRTEKALGKKGLQLALGPSSNLGRGPKPFLEKKRLAKRSNCFAVAGGLNG